MGVVGSHSADEKIGYQVSPRTSAHSGLSWPLVVQQSSSLSVAMKDAVARWSASTSFVLGAAPDRKDNIPVPANTPEYGRYGL